MATASQERNDQVDAEKVSQMRQLLAQPGGQALIEKRYGSGATNSPEYAAAQKAQRAAAERARAQREAAAKEAAQRERSRSGPQREGAQARLDRANAALGQRQPTSDKTQEKVAVQSM
ncbi:MAG: hypothetical protein INR62_05580 [Rhodospirillales bacterium]|nr:hypothetical protein [Acetobacter sp.]